MRDKRTSVLEDLVFAMAVHIMHDLPLALGDISPQRAPDVSHIADFHAVNAMMGSSIDEIEAQVAKRYSPYISWLDHLAGRHDEILTASPRSARARAHTPKTAQAVEGLAVLRNMAAHGRSNDVSAARAKDYLALVDAVLFALRAGPRPG
jgi:hypothetical protein